MFTMLKQGKDYITDKHALLTTTRSPSLCCAAARAWWLHRPMASNC